MLWWFSHALAFQVDRAPDGDPLRWPSFPVAVGWVPTEADPRVGDAGPDALADALAAWSTVPGAAVALGGAGEACRVPSISPFDPNCAWVLAAWPYDDTLLALSSTWSDSRGAILAFDIEVNGERAWSPPGYDLRAALTHEVGHGLGLEHSRLAEATMFATIEPDDASARDLSADDRAGETFLYPADAPGGCSQAPRDGSWRAWAVLALLVALGWRSR
ncbi:MAG: matrixin family metalloprotease [Myxococcota bacterium]